MTRHVDDRLVQAQVAGLSLRQTATACGVSVSTVQRRLRDSAIEAQIAEARRRRREDEAQEWASLQSLARETLREVMTSPDNQQVAVRAALGALGAGDRFDILNDLARQQEQINEAILERLAVQQAADQGLDQ